MKAEISFPRGRQLLPALCILALAAAFTAVPAKATSDEGKPKMVDLWSPGDAGDRMRIRGRVTSLDGTPVPNVVITFRHADAAGMDWSYHLGDVQANAKGVYQFGSVVPGNSHRLSHVHVYVSHEGYQYLDTEFYFKRDPKADPDNPNSIFLEEGTVDDETMLFGRYDITLIPD